MRWIKALWRWALRGLLVLWIVMIFTCVVAWFRSKSTDDYWERDHTIFGQWTVETNRVDVISSQGGIRFHRIQQSEKTGVVERYYRQMAGPRVQNASSWDSYPSGMLGMLRATTGPSVGSTLNDLGFVWNNETTDDTDSYHHVLEAGAPYWAVLLLLMLPAPVVYSLWRKHRLYHHRHRNGLCLRCGYDLRASGEVCPECGTTVVVNKLGKQ